MNALDRVVRAPAAALEFTNVLLTTSDAAIGQSPREVVWTHRKTTLYRYRSNARRHAVPILLVFALINRPEIFDLRPGNSFVEFLLEHGFDVFLVDWGEPDEEDADMGLAEFVCDELHWAVRETLLASGKDELTLLGWCIGGTLCAMYCALDAGESAVRNAVLLTTPIDPSSSLYARWVGREDFDVDLVADGYGAVPGPGIDWANKLMKPLTNYVTTYRRLFQNVLDGKPVRESYQAMAKWVADNPPFPARAFREWITWMYKENRLVDGRLQLRGERVDLRRIEQNLLVVTAGSDHIAPPEGTIPLLDLVSSEDVTHVARPGGHIGLMAGSKAKHEIWPELTEWLAERSDR
jgi:polyhydroxyalkanoate synthase